MTFTRTLKTLVVTTALTLTAGTALAQNTVTIPVNATVANAITLTNVAALDFSTIIAINDGTESASASVDSAGAISFATTGAPAFTAAAGGTPAAGEITLQAVNGQTVNITLQNVVDPTDGTDTLALSAFLVNDPTNGETARTVGTPFTHTADGTAETITIGATITTPVQGTQIGDGAYTGSFDLVASY